jgi:hypothetical protein
MYRDQERVGHFISPELEYPMIFTGIKYRRYYISFPFLNPVHIIGFSSSGDIKCPSLS